VKNQPIPVSRPDLRGNEKAYVMSALDDGWISSNGPFVARFEEAFAARCGVRHAIACCNGTAAVHLSLLALGVGPGDEVLVPSLTYVASANAVTYTGARPILVDSERTYWNLDPDRVEEAITSWTRALMAVHLYGHLADVDALRRIGDRHRIPVLEDAAEAHGAEVRGHRVGSLGLAAAFSFFGNKIVTTGEGGMVTTNDDGVAATVRTLRGQGLDPSRRYWFPVVGYNYRMSNVAAAIGCAQVERFDELVEARRRIARAYTERLAPRAGELGIVLPSQASWARNVHWMMSILVPSGRRDALARRLADEGIETRPFFPPMHLLPIYDDPDFRQGRSLPVAVELAERGLNLPTWAGLTDTDIDRVVVCIEAFLESGQ